ncbi:MAG: glycosyltransferase family protein [Planctomycetota bacterium]|jgi:glycosyltransferase involved in cell wall biosynthesis
MTDNATAVHVTHETVSKVGGIGAVLQGFFTCESYLEAVERSILVGPLFTAEGSASERLGENSEVLYSSIDGFANTGYAPAFRRIEDYYNAGIIYGRRTFVDEQTGIKSSPEVVLVDVKYTDKGPINEFKRRLFDEFGIRSDLYENLWEFEQYVRLAPVAIAVLKAIGAAEDSTVIISHEFMGMPTALAGILELSCNFKTVFYAHEVATMRRIVEKHPGHDTMFYNVLKQAHDDRLYVNEVFGDQNSYFKHSLVGASKYCDRIFAVGDHVVDELRFLAPEFETAKIDIVYNGIPAYQISVAEKLAAKAKLQLYCENMLGYKPDFIFTHVTRLVKSKGMWRDLRVLEQMEKEFRTQNKTAVLLVLSTEVAQRRSRDIYNMESAYNWPVAHREGWPDMSGGEAVYYTAVQEFNGKSRNIKIIFINQFGFEAKRCGRRMPADMEFMDIRKGSDVEFGQSIYEPFGIAQIEPLTFGGICVFSSVCGCSGFLRDITNDEDVRNVIVADYTNLENYSQAEIEDLPQIDWPVRDHIEAIQSEKVAMQICSRLPKNESETESMVRTGHELAKNMSWDVVVKNYLLNSLRKISERVRIS